MNKIYPYPIDIERLKALMKKRHINMSALSRAISPSGADALVRYWVSNPNTRPKKAIIEACCRVLNTSIDYLCPAPVTEAPEEHPVAEPAPRYHPVQSAR